MRLVLYPEVSSAATAEEATGTYISDSTIWEFNALYDMTAAVIYRNGIFQPSRLYTPSVEAGKTRVTFASAINAADEIVLISNV